MEREAGDEPDEQPRATPAPFRRFPPPHQQGENEHRRRDPVERAQQVRRETPCGHGERRAGRGTVALREDLRAGKGKPGRRERLDVRVGRVSPEVRPAEEGRDPERRDVRPQLPREAEEGEGREDRSRGPRERGARVDPRRAERPPERPRGADEGKGHEGGKNPVSRAERRERRKARVGRTARGNRRALEPPLDEEPQRVGHHLGPVVRRDHRPSDERDRHERERGEEGEGAHAPLGRAFGQAVSRQECSPGPAPRNEREAAGIPGACANLPGPVQREWRNGRRAGLRIPWGDP